jgi:hypothetical protein
MVGFAPFPLLRNLLGFAGFLQFFDANFRADARFGGDWVSQIPAGPA